MKRQIILSLQEAMVGTTFWIHSRQEFQVRIGLLLVTRHVCVYLIERRLSVTPQSLSDRLPKNLAQHIATTFLEESQIPVALSLQGTVFSLPYQMRSLGSRFVGRANELRKLHSLLYDGDANAAPNAVLITCGGGVGKTRLAVEYLLRYGPRYYPGGLFWLNAAASDLEGQLWRILSVLDEGVPYLSIMRKEGRSIAGELARALRKIGKPALYIVDNIQESPIGCDPLAIQEFCPASEVVTILATSRQNILESGVRVLSLSTLSVGAAIVTLSGDLPGGSSLKWSEWAQIAEWVGTLPIALDLLSGS